MIAADANDPRGIVWIASYPKSGNTWVRLFLHHLLRIRSGRPGVAREIDHLSETAPHIAGQVRLFEQLMGKPVLRADMKEMVIARAKAQEVMARQARGVQLIKTHSLLGNVFNIPLVNFGLSAGAIYVIRNPLDIAISLQPYLGLPLDETIKVLAASATAPPPAATLVPEIWGSWSENVQSWTTDASEVVRIVRYEDMLADPVAEFTAIAEHMRMGARPDEIASAVEAASFARAAREEQSGRPADQSGKAGRFFRVGKAGQWREGLTADQVERIVEAHGVQMERFGYLPRQIDAALQ